MSWANSSRAWGHNGLGRCQRLYSAESERLSSPCCGQRCFLSCAVPTGWPAFEERPFPPALVSSSCRGGGCCGGGGAGGVVRGGERGVQRREQGQRRFPFFPRGSFCGLSSEARCPATSWFRSNAR